MDEGEKSGHILFLYYSFIVDKPEGGIGSLTGHQKLVKLVVSSEDNPHRPVLAVSQQ